MIKSLMITRKLMTSQDVSTIYFANDTLINDMITWLKARYRFFDEVATESSEKAGMKNWLFECGPNHAFAMLSKTPIACKNYDGQAIIYKITITNPEGGLVLTDTFINKKVAEDLANLFNQNSDYHRCSVEEIMVINDQEALNSLKKFLSSGDIVDQWSYFSKIKP